MLKMEVPVNMNYVEDLEREVLHIKKRPKQLKEQDASTDLPYIYLVQVCQIIPNTLEFALKPVRDSMV